MAGYEHVSKLGSQKREMDHSNLVPLSLKRPGMDYISLPLHQLQPKQNLVKKTNVDLSKIT